MKEKNIHLMHAIKRSWMILIPFLAVFPLLRVSPMMYDGWAGPFYYKQFGGLIAWFQYVMGPFREWVNGRVASNFFCGILESFTSEIPLDVVGALVLAGILFCLFRLFNLQHRVLVACLYSAFLIFMPYTLRTYVVQIALLQYLAPILFFLLMLILLKRYENNESHQAVWLLYPLSVIACTWMENTSLAYGIILAVSSFRLMLCHKKIDWRLVGAVSVALVSGLFMVTAPGMASSRITISGAETFLVFSPHRLYEHIKPIFLTFIYQGSLTMMSMALALAVASGLSAASFRGKQSFISRVLLCIGNGVVFFLSALLGSYTHEFQYTATMETGWYLVMAGTERFYAIIVGIIVLLYILWLPLNVLILCKTDWTIKMLCLYGVLLVAVVLPTSQIGARIYSPLYLVISMLACVAVSRAIEGVEQIARKRVICLVMVVIICILALDFQTQLCGRIKSTQDERMRRIELIRDAQFVDESNDDWYLLPVFNDRDICTGGATDIGTFHYAQFLERYGLSPDTKIVFTNDDSIFVAMESMDSTGIQIHVVNKQAGDWLYDYTVSYKRYSYENYVALTYEPGLTENSYFAEAVNGEGYYQIIVTVTNRETGEQTVLDQKIEQYIPPAETPETAASAAQDISVVAEEADNTGFLVTVSDPNLGNWTYDYTTAYKANEDDEYVAIVYEPGLEENTYFARAVNGSGYYQVTVAVTDVETGAWYVVPQTVEKYVP